MQLNVGYIELASDDGQIIARIYYDTAYEPVGPDQPLVDGPRGRCLDITNVGSKAKVTVLVDGQARQVKVSKGSPAKESRTARQMRQLGFTTRGSVGEVSLINS